VSEIIRLTGVERTYEGAVPVHALRGIDLVIDEGAFVAVTGPSGSGKSTLLHILGCLDRPTAGRYELEGRDVTTFGDRELSDVRNRRIGFVFQAFHLLAAETALENVMLPLVYAGVRDRRERALAALDRVGLANRVDHRPGELSGGEQQRVAIARGLVKHPAILLADEPTGNLDTASGDRILDALDELRSDGLTIVLITHDDAVASRTERVVALRDGRMVDSQERS
jgi:putative ABC transport system ATP-binding protein